MYSYFVQNLTYTDLQTVRVYLLEVSSKTEYKKNLTTHRDREKKRICHHSTALFSALIINPNKKLKPQAF